jgi:hypothetical protein
VKIFISYSRDDAGNFAQHVHKSLRDNGYDVFIDVNSIRIGDPWAGSIEKNISECDIFVVILTPDSLRSNHVDDEVLYAQKKNKAIVPCIHEYVNYNDIKWDLDKIQGIEFSNEYELVLNLYQKIKNYGDIKKPIDDVSGSFSKTIETTTTNVKTSTESDSGRLKEHTDLRQPLKENIEDKEQLKNSRNVIDPAIKKGIEKPTSQDHHIQILGFKLKIIIIPIIALSIIGVIVGIIYFNAILPPTPNTLTSDTIETITPSDTTQAYQFIKVWGSNGTGDGEFNTPWGISIDSSDNVYVVDWGIIAYKSSIAMEHSLQHGEVQVQQMENLALLQMFLLILQIMYM